VEGKTGAESPPDHLWQPFGSVPVRDIKKARGFLQGMSSDIEREEDDGYECGGFLRWLEYFINGPNAAFFAPSSKSSCGSFGTTISLFEVFKRVLIERNRMMLLKPLP